MYHMCTSIDIVVFVFVVVVRMLLTFNLLLRMYSLAAICVLVFTLSLM